MKRLHMMQSDLAERKAVQKSVKYLKTMLLQHHLLSMSEAVANA